MPDVIKPEDQGDESFEKLLKESLDSRDNFTTGDRVTGTVVFITGDSVFLNISGKSEAVIDLAEFKNKEGRAEIGRAHV